VKSVLALLLRTESFTICPAAKKNEKKNIKTIGLSKEELWRINPTIKLSKKKTMENQPNRSKIAPHNSTCLHSQNLQGSLVDVTLESSGKGDVHENNSKESWGETECV